MISYATQFLSLDRSMVLHCMTIVAVLQFVVQLAAAFLAQRFGTTRVLLITGAWARSSRSSCCRSCTWARRCRSRSASARDARGIGYYSVVAGFVSGIFVARIRYTAISIAYQVCGALAGGFTPLVATIIAQNTAPQWWPCAPAHERRDPVVAVRVADLAPREHRRCGRGEPEGNAAAARRSHRVIARNGQALACPFSLHASAVRRTAPVPRYSSLATRTSRQAGARGRPAEPRTTQETSRHDPPRHPRSRSHRIGPPCDRAPLDRLHSRTRAPREARQPGAVLVPRQLPFLHDLDRLRRPGMGLSAGWTTLAGALGIMFGTIFMAFHGSQGRDGAAADDPVARSSAIAA